jgi:hypothetical protein
MLSHQTTAPEATPRIVDANLRYGFAQLPRPILRTKSLTPKAKLVYTLLLDYAWFEDYVFPSQHTIAEALDISIDTVQRALDELRDNRLLDWQQQGCNQPNIYFFLPIEESALKPELESGNRKLRYPETAISTHLETANCGTNETNTNNTNTKQRYPSNIRKADREESDYVNQTASQPITGMHIPPAEKRGEGPHHELVETSRHTTTAEAAGDYHSASIHQNIEKIEREKISPPAERSTIQSLHIPHTARTHAEETAIHTAIHGYIRDAAAKLHDEASLKSSTTRAYNLYLRSGTQLNAFFDTLYDAEQETMRRSAAIRKVTSYGLKNRMAYFFAIVEDKLGLRTTGYQHTPQSP